MRKYAIYSVESMRVDRVLEVSDLRSLLENVFAGEDFIECQSDVSGCTYKPGETERFVDERTPELITESAYQEKMRLKIEACETLEDIKSVLLDLL